MQEHFITRHVRDGERATKRVGLRFYKNCNYMYIKD